MTIEEAIKHCLEVAEQQEADSFIDRWSDDDEWSESLKENCRQCAADHRQLAEWLTELKELKNSIGVVRLNNMTEALKLIRAYKAENATLREENKVLTSECDRLIKEKGELLSKVSGGDVLRICQLEKQLEKAKRLLKSATNVLKMFIPCDDDYCSECIKQRQNCDYDDSFKWLYADEAMKLIKEGETDEQI